MSDVIIIGAGAAGLAAAVDLAARGLAVRMLEARERIGGRCFSVAGIHAAGQGVSAAALPVELGAEFLHGGAGDAVEIMRRHGITRVDAAAERWLARRGRLRPANDAFQEMVRAFSRARWLRRGDLAFAGYLARFDRNSLSPAARQLALRLVEGFDAADPLRVSAREIVEEWTSEGVLGDSQSRPLGGYGAVLRALAADGAAAGAEVRTGAVATRVAWQKGEVQVDVARGGGGSARPTRERHRAARLLVTVPLGVLKQPAGAAGAIEFDPPLRAKRWALDHLESGPVIKLVLEFRSAFWERVANGRYRNAAFLLGPDKRIPTFWTAVPARLPRLVAWAGGNRAKALAGLDGQALTEIAVTDLLSLLGCSSRWRRELQAVHFHDWQADPFARGAYSYVTVGGDGARQRLGRPLAGTVFFAGEAAEWGGEAATVAGAIASGRRAARAMLRSL